MLAGANVRGKVKAASAIVFAAAAVVNAAPVAAQPGNVYEKALQIGVVAGPEEYSFGLIADAAFGPNGHIYVLDRLASEVRVFDSTGKFINRFGRAGGGPGEFYGGTRLLVRGGQVLVLDVQQRRLVTFTLDGSHVETTSVPQDIGRFDVMVPMAGNWWLGATVSTFTPAAAIQLGARSPDEIARRAPVLRRSHGNTLVALIPGSNQVDTLMRYDHGMIQAYLQRGGVSLLPRTWRSGGAWTVWGDSIAVTVDGVSGHVRVLSVGSRGLRVRKEGRVPITPIPLGPNDWAAVHSLLATQGQVGAAKHLEGPRFQPQLGQPVVSDDGVVWIPRISYDPIGKNAEPVVDQYVLLPLDGRQQTTIALPHGLTLAAVHGAKVLGIKRIDHGVTVVEIWERR